MIRKIQLLAHAGAPSARGEDERYRAQLHGYLELQAAPRQSSREVVEVSSDRTRGSQIDAHLAYAPTGDTTFVDDTQLAYQELDSQLVTSSLLDLIGSPPGKRPITDHGPCSSPKSTELSRSSKKRKLDLAELHLDPLKRPTALYVPLLEDGQLGLAHIGDQAMRSTESRVPAGHAALSQDLDADETTSELPTTYSLSDMTSQSSRAKRKEADNQAEYRPNQDGERDEVPPEMGSSHEQRAPDDEDIARSTTIDQIDKQREPSPPQQVGLKYSRHDLHDTLASLSTSVMPPEPGTGRERFTSHVTEALQSLADSPTIGHKYAPVSVTRAIRPLERGYWLVDCSSWQLSAQIDFWQFLERTIHRGSLGWGVWCTREDEGLANAEKGGSIGIIKVFCWGEIVKHVFLLLYVASNSQVKKLGLSWIDAEGTTVVQMPRR
ncbi:hypothetical protein BDY17DRAFT_301650 [Neohortaea acidophila]|uniref:Uncharacterized protein n=1 Tax=Neohortaea acidophila TaxID=245834 RepID=A0A6A6PL07_9PEZI|nr:uncharacterized protein BDY17DRAFT_301650 [Neohortaea acidophila]KAF2480381.1 hypothetical protein BDY17DRAFT_301650 [Neohortaea acidophila]